MAVQKLILTAVRNTAQQGTCKGLPKKTISQRNTISTDHMQKKNHPRRTEKTVGC